MAPKAATISQVDVSFLVGSEFMMDLFWSVLLGKRRRQHVSAATRKFCSKGRGLGSLEFRNDRSSVETGEAA